MISLIVALVVIGLLVYLVGLIPMDATLMQIIRIVAIIVAVVLVLQFFLGVNILPNGHNLNFRN